MRRLREAIDNIIIDIEIFLVMLILVVAMLFLSVLGIVPFILQKLTRADKKEPISFLNYLHFMKDSLF